MYNKILVPLDGSGLAECALAHVKAIALGCNVPDVVLLMVADHVGEGFEKVTSDITNATQSKLREAASNYLSETAGKLKKDGIKTETVVKQGNPAQEILEYIQKNNIDLVILSTHGRSGISRWLMGSVADRVTRHSMAPVLIVAPEGCRI